MHQVRPLNIFLHVKKNIKKFIPQILGGYIFNAIYCNPKGFPVDILNPWFMIISLVVPVFVSLFSSFPLIKFLRNMNTIEVLEGRY